MKIPPSRPDDSPRASDAQKGITVCPSDEKWGSARAPICYSPDPVIVGCGIDVVDIRRVERVLARRGRRFRERVFTERERADCEAFRRPGPQLALRFAAKEAGMKAIGTGWRRGVTWRDFEVVPHPDRRELRLSGRASEIAHEQGSDRVWLAAGLTRTHAIAQVVLERTTGARTES
jgi:holo-[acyl-carrier protein] synthase